MKPAHRLLFPALFALGLTAASPAMAGTIPLVDNLATIIANEFVVNNNLWNAAGFRTTAQAYTLTSITLAIRKFGAPTGNFAIQVYDATGTGNAPGAWVADVATVVAASLPTTTANYVVDNFSIGLNPDTNYFLLLRGITMPSGFVLWSGSSQAVGNPGAPTSFYLSNNSGTSWTSNTSTPAVLQILATGGGSVPEPASFGLFGLGLLAMGFARNRRMR